MAEQGATWREILLHYYGTAPEPAQPVEIPGSGGSTSQRNVEFLEQFADYIRGLAAQAEATTQPQSAMPARPPEPDTCNLEDWFDYYHRCRKAGYKVTLEKLAEKTGYSHGHVRQRHAEYMAEHGHT